MMKRLLPTPLLSLALLLLWLLLNRSLSAGHWLMAVLLALLIPLLTQGLRPLSVRVRRPGTIVRLLLVVLLDSIRSNIALMRFLLLPSRRRYPAGFVYVPLEVRDPHALAVLAMIVCITPGTAWAELALDRSVLLLHVLELDDADAIVAHIKQQYERRLMEIFEP